MTTKLLIVLGVTLFCGAFANKRDQLEWWYGCTWGCKHEYIRDGDIRWERITCPDGWFYQNNQIKVWAAEKLHRESQFKDKQERERAMKVEHSADADGVHYRH